jgi:hypothetical protein
VAQSEQLSRFIRKSPAEREASIDRLCVFSSWIDSLHALTEIARSDDMTLAVAQHHGLPTTLILQLAFEPARLFAFNRLKSGFCTQIVPTQVRSRGG